MKPMYVMTITGSIHGAAHEDQGEVRRLAQGHLLSRGSDNKAVIEVRRVIPGVPRAGWPVVASVRRRNPHGPLEWTEHEQSTVRSPEAH